MNKTKRIVISAVITLVVLAIAFYVVLPPLNPQSVEFWGFAAFAVVFFGVCNALVDYKSNGVAARNKFKTKNKVKKDPFYIVVTVIAIIPIAVILIGNIISSTFFNAYDYANIITVKDAVFEEIAPGQSELV